MEGLGRAAGSGVPINFRGETIILPPLDLEDLGTIEQHLLRTRPDPLQRVQAVIKDLPENLARELVEKAYEDGKKLNTISAAEVGDYLDSINGLAFSVWLALQKRYGDKFSHKNVYNVLNQLTAEELEELRRARDQASGLDDRGNSTGPALAQTKPGVSQAGGRSFVGWPARIRSWWARLRAFLRRSSGNGASTSSE